MCVWCGGEGDGDKIIEIGDKTENGIHKGV